jgi:hypothetical protein
MEITRANLYAALRAVLPFVSSDPTREMMNGVYVASDAAKQTAIFVATNGHVLTCARVAATVPDEERGAATFATLGVKQLIANVKPNRGEYDQIVNLNVSGFVSFGSTSMALTLVDGLFPPYQTILDSCGSVKAEPVSLGPRYLELAAKAAQDLNHNNRDFGMVVRHNGALYPVLLTFDAGADVGTLSIVIMPRREK